MSAGPNILRQSMCMKAICAASLCIRRPSISVASAGAEAVNPMRRQMLRGSCIVRQHADLSQCAPVHRQRGQTSGTPVMRERVEETVGRRVVRLPRRADQRADGREHDEMIQPQTSRGTVQIPRTGDLGRHDRRKSFAE